MEPKIPQDSTAIVSDDGCDESKCVSRGLSGLYGRSFTCYGDSINGSDFPMMCADGFLPRVVNSELSYLDESEKIDLSYFTCCPPDNIFSEATTTMDATRRCSDPLTIDDGKDIDSICNDQQFARKYLRRTETENVFLCCDSELDAGGDHSDNDDNFNTTTTTTTTAIATDFLADTECVPYRNNNYDAAKIRNRVGSLPKAWCRVSEGSFYFARPIGNVASTGRYQCCKTGPAMPQYVKDGTFAINVYPQLVLYIVAAIASAIVAIGLLIPLLIQLKNGTFQKAHSTKRRGGGGAPVYSTYNLYLVYLALPDFTHLIFEASEDIKTITQQDTATWSIAMGAAYSVTNLWLNAIVCYEVLVMLRKSKRAQRVDQPSLKRVHLQVGCVYLLLAVTFCLNFFVRGPALYATGIPVLVAPILYVLYVSIVVCCQGLMPKASGTSRKAKAIRGLAIYFFRIVGIFFAVWIPNIALTYWALNGNSLGWYIGSYTPPVQALATTCLILTKSDVRKHIWDLLTLSYVFGNKDEQSRVPVQPSRAPGLPGDSSPSTQTPSILTKSEAVLALKSSERYSSLQDVSSVEACAVDIGPMDNNLLDNNVADDDVVEDAIVVENSATDDNTAVP